MATNPHDPGADAAAATFDGSDGRGREPVRCPERRLDPHRHGVVDRPDDDRGRRLLPDRRRQRRGAAAVLRVALPARRGRRDVLRAAGPPDVRAVGRAHAARLHVRHQGARPDDRPADRDQAAAEGPPRGAPGRGRREDADLRQGPARRPEGRRLGVVRRRARAARRGRPARARSCSSTRAGSSPRRRTATPSRTPSSGCARSA